MIDGDSFDPRTWGPDDHEYRIYLDNKEIDYVLVDQEDYEWAIQWKWKATKPCPIQRRKKYARRTPSEYSGGVRIKNLSIYLHVAIMLRSGKKRPSRLHKLVDHRNRNTLDCRRKNLRWATQSMNNSNRTMKAKPKRMTVEDCRETGVENEMA